MWGAAGRSRRVKQIQNESGIGSVNMCGAAGRSRRDGQIRADRRRGDKERDDKKLPETASSVDCQPGGAGGEMFKETLNKTVNIFFGKNIKLTKKVHVKIISLAPWHKGKLLWEL